MSGTGSCPRPPGRRAGTAREEASLLTAADDPAFVIVQDNGNKVLKLQSEVKAAG